MCISYLLYIVNLMYSVYLLKHTTQNKTYVGSTNNLARRIRQHNGELVGGAKYTTANKKDGLWIIHGTINELDRHTALSIEKSIQLTSRRMKGVPLERRLKAIERVLGGKTYSFVTL